MAHQLNFKYKLGWCTSWTLSACILAWVWLFNHRALQTMRTSSCSSNHTTANHEDFIMFFPCKDNAPFLTYAAAFINFSFHTHTHMNSGKRKKSCTVPFKWKYRSVLLNDPVWNNVQIWNFYWFLYSNTNLEEFLDITFCHKHNSRLLIGWKWKWNREWTLSSYL